MSELARKFVKLNNGMEVQLRSPQADEAASFLDAMRIVMQTSKHLLTEPDEFNYTVEEEAETIRSYSKHPDKIWIVPYVEGKIAGALNFSPGAKRRVAHQGSLGISLLSQYRGIGLGRLMMEEVIEWAIANPRLEQVRLKVHAGNENALRLYQSVGFTEEGRELRGVKFGHDRYDDVIMMVKQVK